MNREDYVKEIHRQLDDSCYYKKLDNEYSSTAENNIIHCISEIEKTDKCVNDEFDIFPETIRTPQFYILPNIHKSYNESLPI